MLIFAEIWVLPHQSGVEAGGVVLALDEAEAGDAGLLLCSEVPSEGKYLHA